MKYFSFIVLFSSLIACGPNTKPQTGELIVTGQYCKYPNNDFLALPFQLFHNNDLIKKDTVEFSRDVKFDSLPYGTYVLKFESIYNFEEKVEFKLEGHIKEIPLCIDKLDYALADRNLQFDKVKSNQSLKIDFNAIGCFHHEQSILEIAREDKLYFAKMNNTKIVLNDAQKKLIREFEIELREIQNGWCTTTHNYILTTSENSKSEAFTDQSCSWNGFTNLIELLGFINSTDGNNYLQ